MADQGFPPLPQIMVAPNGARRTKADHAALPVTVEETVAAAKACFEAGAGALHAHVRDADGAHVLDAGLYRQLLAQMKAAVPDMLVQITTEAVGRYSPEEQRDLVRGVRPDAVSIAVREMIPDDNMSAAQAFYGELRDQGCAVQHILYSVEDVDRFFDLDEAGVIPARSHQLLFVLGRYAADQQSAPEDLEPFLETLAKRRGSQALDWAVCAFGHRETECLVAAIRQGGKARIGFENSLWNSDGKVALDNADRVRDLAAALKAEGLTDVPRG
ncbi:3-keto-5-aminohexanoate cleavage protein [Roseibium sediminicola]|uniref:3-keto-5-aminohexanoate cleavage protein n=1 Tax=Roseibium sediminicola TaxID=2933272 RepID=A0ABT0H1U6_9HYPH|nr:3-keto-5-aminohexanoate cleavage protein [Roseibium sp. CAU 1639]MCK7615634.1 3-keto-5-aminohexanoate cleavage protein [Roseibium sp. CAU 1639]